MSVIMNRDLFAGSINFPNLNLHPSVISRFKSRVIIIPVGFMFLLFCSRRFPWNIIVTYFNESLDITLGGARSTVVRRNDYIKAVLLATITCARILICRVVKWNAYFKGALLISTAYATLLVVNVRYIWVIIIPITVLIFIRALFVAAPPNENSRSGEDDHDKANKDNDNGLRTIAMLSFFVLCCMGHFHVDNFVVSQFLLFLTSTLGELALMMAMLSSKVTKAYEIIHRSALILVLAAAHVIAAELLGDDVVISYTPELIACLIWISIHFYHGCDGFATIRIDMVTSHRTPFILLISVVIAVLAGLPAFVDGSEGAMDLFWTYKSLVVSCSFSVILLSLCVFALHQWQAKTTAAPSLESEWAIKLLSLLRDIMLIIVAVSLVVTLFDVRLRLQAQGLVSDILKRFFNNCCVIPSPISWKLDPIS